MKKQNIGGGERAVSGVAGAALLAIGRRRRSPTLSVFGLEFLRRALSGRSFFYRALGADTRRPESFTRFSRRGFYEVRRSVTINRPRDELYGYWRNFANFRKFIFHLRKLEILDRTRSHWVFEAPGRAPVEWTAEITEDVPNERISWRMTPESKTSWLQLSGSIRFVDAPGNRGTEVHGLLRYRIPGRAFGRAILMALGRDPDQQLRANLRRFKKITETGEIVVSLSPSGRTAA